MSYKVLEKVVAGVDSDDRRNLMCADVGQSEPSGGDGQLQTSVRWARRGYALFVGTFVIGVLVHVYLAGMAILMDPTYWSLHTTFVHVLELIPAIMLVFAFPGRLPRKRTLLPVGLFVLIIVQYATAIGFSGAVVAALHLVNALAMFWIAIATTRQAWSSASKDS